MLLVEFVISTTKMCRHELGTQLGEIPVHGVRGHHFRAQCVCYRAWSGSCKDCSNREAVATHEYKVSKEISQTCMFLQKIYSSFSKITKHLCKLLEKDIAFTCDAECVQAFETLKKALTTAPILISPDWTQPLSSCVMQWGCSRSGFYWPSIYKICKNIIGLAIRVIGLQAFWKGLKCRFLGP